MSPGITLALMAKLFHVSERELWDAAQAKGISIRIETEYGELPSIQCNLSELREALTKAITDAKAEFVMSRGIKAA